MRTKIIYEDDEVLVIYKPAGLPTQTAKIGQQDVVSELKNYLAKSGQNKKVPYLAVIHRLDQPVEGLLIFGKTKQAGAALTAQLGGGVLTKRYYAVVYGQPKEKTGELVNYLQQTGQGFTRIVSEDVISAGAKETKDVQKTENASKGAENSVPQKAVLQYRVVRSLSTSENLFLMDIHIDTGRFHQIRAQMAHAGMPLLGDGKYGTEQSMERSRCLGVRNVALCAYQLECKHPKTGKRLSFSIEPAGNIFHEIDL